MQSRKQIAKLAAALEGIPVWGCLPGSAAARLGVRYGDVILEVNGQRTATVDAYIAARNMRRDGLAVVIFRDGREHALETSFEASADPMSRAQLQRAAQQLAAARLLATEERTPPSEKNLA